MLRTKLFYLCSMQPARRHIFRSIWVYTLMVLFLSAAFVPVAGIWMQSRHRVSQQRRMHSGRLTRSRLSLMLSRRGADRCFLKGGKEMWHEGMLYDVLSVQVLNADLYLVHVVPDLKEVRLLRLCTIYKTPFSRAGQSRAWFHFLCTKPCTLLPDLCAPRLAPAGVPFAVCGCVRDGFREIFAPPPEYIRFNTNPHLYFYC